MHIEALYQFILFSLLKEEKSNFLFKMEAMFLGKRKASIRYFCKLYAGCDIPTFIHYKELFEEEFPQMSFDILIENIEKDKYGLMTGKITL